MAADLRSNDRLAGALIQQHGEVIARVNVVYGKPKSSSGTETRFVRVLNGSATWLSHLAEPHRSAAVAQE